jgi:hypothetical protein
MAIIEFTFEGQFEGVKDEQIEHGVAYSGAWALDLMRIACRRKTCVHIQRGMNESFRDLASNRVLEGQAEPWAHLGLGLE